MIQFSLISSVFFIIHIYIGETVFICPDSCSCISNNNQQLEIKCNFCPSYCAEDNEIEKFPFTLETLKPFLNSVKQNISYLSLSCINLESIPDNYFKEVKFQRFRCYKCNIRSLSSNAFAGLEGYLEEINLERNKLTEILDQFKGLSSLKKVVLKFNNISSLSADAFNNAEDSLESLDLQANSLTSMNAVKKLKMLKILNICSNNLEFPPTKLELPVSLESLEICGANFSKIAINTLKDHINLKQLKIIDSSLKDIEPGSFDSLKAISSVVLGYNKLSSVEGIFRYNSQLKELYLYNNEITHVSKELFNGLTKLETLSFIYNAIKTIDVTAFKGLTALSFLTLTGNKIQAIQPDTFINLSNLTNLNLDYNEINNLPLRAFNGLDNLELLRLTNNKLTEIKKGVFDLPSLKKLDLSNNEIANIEKGALDNLKNLRSLFLYNNIITDGPFILKEYADLPTLDESYITDSPPIIEPPFFCVEEE